MQNNGLPQGITGNSISLMLGHPDPTTLFTPQFQEAVNRVLTSPQPHQALEYGQEQGNTALIDYLVEKFSRDQQMSLSADQLMLVAGSTHAVDMIARLYTSPGDAVMVEAPTYADALHIFRDHGAELHGVPVDEQGAIVEEMEALLRRLSDSNRAPRLFYTIPNFHNPAGVTLAAERRAEIIRLAHQCGFAVVEDDVYRDLAFNTSVPASFFALANGADVMHIGSFSKTLAPGLRLGWLVASRETIQRFVNCGTSQMGGGASPFASQIVAEYCRQGFWEAHVEELRRVYQMRRDVLLEALERYMPDGVTWTKPAGGFFVWVTLPEHIQGREVKQHCLQRGVMVAAGEGYFVESSHGAHHLRLTYSFAPPEDIESAVRILAEVIDSLSV
jgi:2-aminoadipate transaminase